MEYLRVRIMVRFYHSGIFLRAAFCVVICWLLGSLGISTAGTASQCTPRTGFVTLQIDDSHDIHYWQVYPLLQQHGLKASFGYVTESSDLGIEHNAGKIRVIALAGHEIQDHTTRHDYMWATHVDTLDDGIDEWIPWTFADSTVWDSLCERSLFILDSLGIDVVGWNHPGAGTGCGPGHPTWRWLGAQNDTLNRVIGRRYPYALGSHVFANTAHLNLRGHNHPDRWPFFNVPHVTIDYRSLEEIKTGIADAVASGLWYLAAGHAQDMAQVAKLDSLMDWLVEKDIEVLRCVEGWQRIEFGIPDPWANQLPQGRMLVDLDGNGKPDGFTGACAWDTVSVPPVAGLGCLRIFGDTEFCCYGPEVGTNHLSFWLKSATGCTATLTIWEIDYDFDWQILETRRPQVEATCEWTHVDSCSSTRFLMETESEVDRILFRLHVA